MAINTSPVFGRIPKLGVVTLTAANTARDGSGTIATLVAGAADGTRIDKVTFISAQATAAASATNTMRVWRSIDTGTTWYLYQEALETGVTASNTAIGATTVFSFPDGIFLKDATHLIGVTMSIRAGAQDDHDVIAEGSDFTA